MSAYIEIKTAWRAAGGNPEVTPTAERLLSSLRLLAKLREDAEQLSSENDRLQTRVSALHDVALDLRERLLAALTVLRRMEADSILTSPENELTAALLGVSDDLAPDFGIAWAQVRPDQHPLRVGMLVASTEGECDCGGEPEEERETGHDAVGQIVSADDYVEQGWTYGVVFGNGTSVNLLASELEDADAYAVAPAPFVSPEGV